MLKAADSGERKFVVVGAGPAGLSAAYELTKFGHAPTVIEKSHVVGGLAQTENYNGYHFDMGGHRFFTKSAKVFQLWQEVLGDDLLIRPRLSRIYYRKKFFDYPLKPLNALSGLGAGESFRIIASYLRWKALPCREEKTFEQWVTNRFGKRLFEVFFESYTEKVWGIPCHELRAEWAAQRIKDFSLGTALLHMFIKSRTGVRTLVNEFHYPRLGPGMLWNCVKDIVNARGGNVLMDADVVKIARSGDRIESMTVRQNGKAREIHGTDFISSMPVTELVKKIFPRMNPDVLAAAERLQYRDFLTVCLVVKKPKVFPDNWIYVHEPKVKVARIQNYKNWSPDMVPDPEKTSLGLEYFCQRGDELWTTPDHELVDQGKRELEAIGLLQAGDVEDGCVFRVPQAYPVYDSQYHDYLETIKGVLGGIRNLQAVGRNGLHRYNNQDHAMLTGFSAVRNALCGDDIDLWSINADQEYHEEAQGGRVSERLENATTG